MTFKIGDKVTWTSQSQGSATTKTGEIVAVVRPGAKPPEDYPALYRQSHYAFSRKHESYVVSANGKHYWPRVSQLKLVETL